MIDADKIRAAGLGVIETEALALENLKTRIDENFVEVCRLLLACKGRIIVSGMGKSGHIASKIAATLASTGSPAFFVHPGEASHGDLGMVQPDDVFIAMSYSGNNPELLLIMPMIKRLGVPIVTMTGKIDSQMAQLATVNLDVSVQREACPLGLAPTASTTATLAMGDAVAVALLESRGFNSDDFALSHPGGTLGRRLLLRVDDVMLTGDAIPVVAPQASLSEALINMSSKSCGMTIISDESKTVLGIFTDGDLRRAIDNNVDVHKTLINQVMTTGGFSILIGTLAIDALEMMEKQQITVLPVIEKNGVICGALKMHDLLRSGVV